MASARLRGKRWSGLYRDADGAQRHAGTYDTKEEALHWAKVAELDAHPPKPPEMVMVYPETKRGRITVAAYAPGWLDRLLVRPNTRLAYQLSLKHIVNAIGAKTVAEVQPEDIRRIIRALKTIERSDSTIHHAVAVATLMFRDAAREKLRDDNPCDGIKHKVDEQREIVFATREQAKAIEDAAAEPYRLLIRTLFATGCRWSEAIAIKGTDVEQRGTGHVLQIRRTIGETSGVELYVRNYGKSAKATRAIPIFEELALELMAFGDKLCFTNAKGGYLRRSDFRSGVWMPAVKKAGIPRLRVHDTRHSHASWLANFNDPPVPLAAVRDRLGHSSLAVTSRYVHVMPGDDPCLAALDG
jgi:integrase